jgi:formiminotetrahydrofolate cyclodeaminase
LTVDVRSAKLAVMSKPDRAADAATEGRAGASLLRFLESLASSDPAPAGGSAAAVTVALAAGLTSMVSRILEREAGARTFERTDDLMRAALAQADRDAAAYGEVLAARRKHPRRPGTAEIGEEVSRALSRAADVPLRTAEIGAEVAEIAARLRSTTSPLRGDAATAALLAAAGTRAAARLVEINLVEASLPDDSRVEAARSFAMAASAAIAGEP